VGLVVVVAVTAAAVACPVAVYELYVFVTFVAYAVIVQSSCTVCCGLVVSKSRLIDWKDSFLKLNYCRYFNGWMSQNVLPCGKDNKKPVLSQAKPLDATVSLNKSLIFSC